ncbi:MAG: cell division protein SepF [Ilumatobacteraceae bacterium]
MSMFRRAMDYLGLGPDEAYDDYDQSVAQNRPAPRRRDEPVYDDDVYVDDDDVAYDDEPAPRARTRARVDDSGVAVRPIGGETSKTVRPLTTATVDPLQVKPTRYDHAQEIADRFKNGQPILMNLVGTDKETKRRLIDFASGLCYGLNGTLERLSGDMFRLTPNGVRIPRD